MKYKVTMTNVGRSKANPTKVFDTPPDYGGLLGMVRGCLISSEIDFGVSTGEYPVCQGKVLVGGWRPVGEFKIEEAIA